MTIKPKLGLFDLTMITVSLVIGIGIFRTPAIVAQKAEVPWIFFAAWILGGVVSICGALTFAEIGSRLPAAGGFYKIFSHCFHPAYAFMLNWSIVITNAASAVGVAIVGAEYINPVLLPAAMQNDMGIKITATTVVLILYGLNYLGIKMGARAQNLLSMIKIIMILLFCFAIFGNHTIESPTVTSIAHSPFDIFKIVGICLISVFFTYGGYQNTTNFGADIKNPEKNISRAIFIGIAIVVALYTLINLAYYYVLGFEGLKNSKLVASELAKAFFGDKGYAITSIVIFASIVGFINTSIMHNPRMYYAMADDKILPPIFKRVNPKTMTQEFALTFFVGLMILSLFLLGTFEKILNYVMFIDSLSLASAAIAIFIFRQREKANKDKPYTGYKIKWYPLVPIIFLLIETVVTISVPASDLRSATYGFIIFLLGYPLYIILKKIVTPQQATANP